MPDYGAYCPVQLTSEVLADRWTPLIVRELLLGNTRFNDIARARGQTMAQMAIAWVLRHKGMTSALIGASRPQQIEDVAAALNNLAFSGEELQAIDAILAG